VCLKHAYVAPKDGHEVTEAALKRFLEVRISAYKVPKAIRFLSDLPKGPTGKVARQTLRQWSAGAPPVQGPARKTTTESTFAGGRPPLGGNKSPDPGTQSNRSKT
jgi:acyl-coenzyme A synthetase/AMP-(fatty) acid ligase